MGSRALAMGNLDLVGKLVREEGAVPAEGDGVDLSTRIYLDHH